MISCIPCWLKSAVAENVEMAAVDEPAIQQRPAEPVVQQTETEIVDETKYMNFLEFCR